MICPQVLGLPVIRVAGVEADDVIGTLATRATDDGFLVAVASPDKARLLAIQQIHMAPRGASLTTTCTTPAFLGVPDRVFVVMGALVCQRVTLLWPLSQDFFQILRPGLQLLRPPKRNAVDGPGVVAGFVAYSYDAFKAEFGIEPCQAIIPVTPNIAIRRVVPV